MGRLFEKELQLIDSTYIESLGAETSEIEKFMAVDAPVLVIGSGGSFSAAKMTEYFFSRIGFMAKAITPLQLEEHYDMIYQSKVILLTARGNNADILNAFHCCELLEAKAILGVCCSAKSKLQERFRFNGSQFLWAKDMSFRKDGYLSVNSLVTMIIVMAQAMYHFSGNDFFKLPQKVDFDIQEQFLEKYDSVKALRRDSIIVLHGGSTTPVAIDMESKFCEVALGNIQLVDYRNFAHGRHYWLSKRAEETGIIAFIDNTQQVIAEKTLNLVPDGIPVCSVKTEYDGVYGILMLYKELFGIVYSAGKINNVNPGKPLVPDYGRKLYHINYKYKILEDVKKISKNINGRAAYRKNGSLGQTHGFLRQYEADAENFRCMLENKIWHGLIFDYDGTLHWKGKNTDTEEAVFEYLNCFLQKGCKIAVSTGRGKSVRIELQERIPEDLWKDIAIGYYNGSVCGWLDDNTIPQKISEAEKKLTDLYRILERNRVWRSCFDGWEEPKPKQWSLSFKACEGKAIAFEILKEHVCQQNGLKVAASSHSVDVMGSEGCKRNILDLIKKRWKDIQEEDFLFVGDSGELGGNDFELLCSNGLSVERVSKSGKSCFNFAPLGMRQLEATLYYLEHIKVNIDGTFSLQL